MEDSRSILVYGAGAVGGFLGGRLAAAGTSAGVTLLARPAVAKAVENRGLILREPEREDVTRPAVVTSAEGIGPFDLVLLTVRTYDVPAAIPDLQRLIGWHGRVAAFQNGVGTEEELAAALGPDHVLAATLTVSVGMEEPGVVTRYSRSGGVALATMDGGEVPGRLVDLFRRAGLDTVTISDYRALRWSKLLLNLLGSGSTAILDSDMRDVAADPTLFRVEQLAFREAARVMAALGIGTAGLPGYPVPMAQRVMRLPRPIAQRIVGPRMAGARSGRAPGMRDGVARGRTEVDAYHGAIARAGEEAGVPAPVNAALAALIRELTRQPGRRAEFQRRPEALIAYLRQRAIRV